MSEPRRGGEFFAPTRLELLKARRRLGRVKKGVELLQRKREALVTEFFRLARPAADTRARIAELARRAYPKLLSALSYHGEAELRARSWPGREIALTLRAGQIWGVSMAEIVERPSLVRSLGARAAAPATVGLSVAQTAEAFERFADLLLDAASKELLIRRLGEALARTSRQLNTLKERVAPAIAARVATVRRALEEAERDEHVRLRRLLKARA